MSAPRKDFIPIRNKKNTCKKYWQLIYKVLNFRPPQIKHKNVIEKDYFEEVSMLHRTEIWENW